MLYAFDGTWDDWDPGRETLDDEPARDGPYTNVVLFAMEYRNLDDPEAPASSRHRVSYVNGVGSRFRRLGAALGGALGIGATHRVNQQFKRLQRSFREGDTTIDVIGYSRGAAVARMFVDRVYGEYRDLVDEHGNELTEPPPVRFLGLFDTVASFGFAWTDEEWNFQPRVPDTVLHARHALSMDERRETFDLDRIAEPFDESRVKEVWFRGGHGDIGGNACISKQGSGGWEANRARTNIALAWMLKEARFSAEIPFAESTIERYQGDTDPGAPITASNDPFDFNLLGIVGRRDRALEMDEDDLYHETTRHPLPKRTIHGIACVRVPEGASKFVS